MLACGIGEGKNNIRLVFFYNVAAYAIKSFVVSLVRQPGYEAAVPDEPGQAQCRYAIHGDIDIPRTTHIIGN